MISAFVLAVRQALAPPLRAILLKSIGLAVLLLVVLGIGLDQLLRQLVVLQNGYLDTAAAILTGLGVFAGMVFLVPPVVSLVAGLFLDDAAEIVEQDSYPADAPGQAQPVLRSLWLALQFALVVLGVNVLSLFLLFIPGINIAAWWLANGYLLGREYFELAAMRFRSPAEARALRRAHRGEVFLGGLLLAFVLAIPIVNLATPIVGTAFMVHLHKKITGRRISEVTPARVSQERPL